MKKKILMVFLLLAMSRVHAQENISLHIGDPAPALKYSKWVKGTPMDAFKDDHIYVLEFWATWCHPCLEAMPHLTELQKRYQGKITIIAVSIAEMVKEGEPYDSSVPKVERFVKRNSANMEFSVTTDNNDKFMKNNWMLAAGLGGIPSTFIIQNKKIVWIGEPTELESTLEQILTGRYNMQAYIQSRKKATEDLRTTRARNKELMRPFQEAIEAKDYKKALTLIDGLIAEPLTLSKDHLYEIKFGILLDNGREQEAVAWGKRSLQLKLSQYTPYWILSKVTYKEGLDKTTYLWAAQNFNFPASEMYAGLLHRQALCYAKGGDYKNAAKIEELAVARVKKELENEVIGISDETVAEYEETLLKYKKF